MDKASASHSQRTSPRPSALSLIMMFPYSMLCKTSMRLVISSPCKCFTPASSPHDPSLLLHQDPSSQVALQIAPHRLHLLDQYRIAQLSTEVRQRMQVESPVSGRRTELREHSAQDRLDRHPVDRETRVHLSVSLRPVFCLDLQRTGLWSQRTTSCTPHAAPTSRPTFVTWLKFASFVSSDLPRKKSS